MKTYLYLSKFQQQDNTAFQTAINVTPDEIVTWEGDNTVLQHDISAFPCLVIDLEGAEKEMVQIDPETKEEITVSVPMPSEVFEHRKGEVMIAARLAELQATGI